MDSFCRYWRSTCHASCMVTDLGVNERTKTLPSLNSIVLLAGGWERSEQINRVRLDTLQMTKQGSGLKVTPGGREPTLVWMVKEMLIFGLRPTWERAERKCILGRMTARAQAPEKKWSRCVQRTERKPLVGFSGWSSESKGRVVRRWCKERHKDHLGRKGLSKELTEVLSFCHDTHVHPSGQPA